MTADSWHKERLTGIGGSDSPVIVLGKYFGRTAHDLFLEKTGQIQSPDIDTPDTRRGKRQEPIAVRLYEQHTGYKTRKVNTLLRHPTKPFMIAHIDREILNQDAILEVKCPRTTTFRKWQLQGIPEGAQIQGQHYLSVKRKGVVVIAVFCAELDELITVPIERDNELIDLIESKEEKFWNYVQTKAFPESDIIRAEPLGLPPIGGELIKIETEEWKKAAEALQDAIEIKKEAEELYGDAKEKIIALMGDYGVVEGFNLRCYNKWQTGRLTLDKKRLAFEHPELDLTKYEKQGKAFQVFRPYFLKERSE